jgi:hypothetical protein
MLASKFDDSWTVIAGYRNRRGEIDLVSVGPAGIALAGNSELPI